MCIVYTHVYVHVYMYHVLLVFEYRLRYRFKVLIHHIEAHLTTEAVAIKGDAFFFPEIVMSEVSQNGGVSQNGSFMIHTWKSC